MRSWGETLGGGPWWEAQGHWKEILEKDGGTLVSFTSLVMR